MINNRRILRTLAASAGLSLILWSGVGTAHARDIQWSIGLSSPGVVVGVGSGAPVYVAPAPVYVAPRPSYYAPPPPVVYAPPRPVYYAPPAYYSAPPGHYYRDRHHGRDHGHRHGRHDRHDRHGGYGDRWDR